MLISRLTDSLISKGLITSSEKSLYEYGINAIIYTVWSTGLLLLIGLVLHQFSEAVIIIFGFYTLQTYGGGYHANTHAGCFSIMAIGLTSCLMLIRFIRSEEIFWIFGIICICMLLFFPLTLHRHKKYLMSQKEKLKRKSLLATGILVVISFLLRFLFSYSIKPMALMFTVSAISRIIGIAKNSYTPYQ